MVHEASLFENWSKKSVSLWFGICIGISVIGMAVEFILRCIPLGNDIIYRCLAGIYWTAFCSSIIPNLGRVFASDKFKDSSFKRVAIGVAVAWFISWIVVMWSIISSVL